MGMSDAYGPAYEAESIETIHRALELGVNLFDTSAAYGLRARTWNESTRQHREARPAGSATRK
jgi:aryl-alcohol dehydrogenase-like predicted oxidoreductase